MTPAQRGDRNAPGATAWGVALGLFLGLLAACGWSGLGGMRGSGRRNRTRGWGTGMRRRVGSFDEHVLPPSRSVSQ